MKKHPMMAAYVLAAFWLGSWGLHLWMEWLSYVDDQATHASSAVFWSWPFWVTFFRATFENVQSEMLQILTAAWVFKHFFWSGSPESKNESDRVEAKIDRIQAEVEDMRRSG